LDPASVAANSSLYLEMIHPNDLAAAMDHAARVTTTGERLDVTHHVVRPDGEVRLVRMQSETQRDETGEMTLHFGTALDVTDQRRAEDELTDANARLHQALTAARAGTWEWDPSTEEGRWSRELAEIYDVEPDHPTDGDSWMGVVHPLDRDAATRDFEAAVERGTEILRDWRVDTRDGSVRWIRSRGMPEIDADGHVVRYVGVDIDVTEQRVAQHEVDRLNNQLAGRVRELAAANENLNELLYSLAHDLRSPLRAIDGFSLAFAEDHVDTTDEKGAEQIGRVRAAAKRLGMLFDAALELASVRRGEVALRRVDLTALSRSLAEDLRALDPERGTVVVVADDLTAVTDESLARTVLEQLLANAWTATGSRSPGHIEVGATVVEGERRYFVRDDGVGFDQSYAAKVFGSYQQLQPPDACSGAGVGLTMVRHATGRLGGRCWAEAEQDRGATFWFTLDPGPADAGVDDVT
jgi:PAS domain S-box-containing protein